MMRGVGGVRKSIDQSCLVKGLGLGLLCLGFKGVQLEIQSEEMRTLQISTRIIHQSTSPSLSKTILPRWASRQFLTLPIVQTLLPVILRIYLVQRLSLWNNWGNEMAVTKVIDTHTQEDFHGPSRSCWNGRTSALQPEEITSKGTKISCVYYQ